MSKFNEKQKTYHKTTTYEGGAAYTKDPVSDWMNFLFSSFLENQYYETGTEQTDRFIQLTENIGEKYGWEFVAKCAHFARNEIGMRSVSELTAAILNAHPFDDKRKFYAKYFRRPDGISEVFAAIDMLGDKRSHALIRGAADYMNGLSEYQIAKYKMKGKTYNMYDLINLTHAHSPAIQKYKEDILAPADTWEVNISAAANEEERNQNWKSLVEEKKLGYLALIRNLRNIVSAAPNNEWVETYLVPQICDTNAIEKSLVFPYQIYCAWKNYGINNFAIDCALGKAFKQACSNMPKMDGRNLIILDVSGSMECRISSKSDLTIKEVGAVYATAMLISTNADFVKFGNYAKKIKLNPLDNPFNIVRKMEDNDGCGWGTYIKEAFNAIGDTPYDRIFIVSDMQVMDGEYRTLDHYRMKSQSNPHVYSFDLSNYHSTILKSNDPKVHLLTTLDDTVFKMIPFVENGQSLVDYINKNYSY